MTNNTSILLRHIAEKSLEYRRKDNGISPKGQWNIAEKPLEYRRKDISVSPKKR